MLFLNPGLLIGLLLASIPVLIHLFHRRSAKRIAWGAMRFLRTSLVHRSRRIQFEDALLLMLRVLLLASLALLVARPYLPPGGSGFLLLLCILGAGAMVAVGCALWADNRWRRPLLFVAAGVLVFGLLLGLLDRHFHFSRLGFRGQKDVVIVLDGSGSMERMVGSRTLDQQARDEIADLLGSMNRGAAVGLVHAGDTPIASMDTPLPKYEEVTERARDLPAPGGSMSGLDAVKEAVLLLSRGEHPGKDIVVFTDGQQAGWQTEEPTAWEGVAAALKQLPHAPRLILRTLDAPEEIRNLAIDEVTFSRRVVGTDRPVLIRVSVSNPGTESVTAQSLGLVIGEQELEPKLIGQLAPGQSETFVFRHRFGKAGSWPVSAVLEVDDELRFDNRRTEVLAVNDRLRVLVVDDLSSPTFLGQSSATLALALSPEMLNQDVVAARLPVEVVRMDVADIDEMGLLEAYHVVVLADLPRIPEGFFGKLTAFVERGGGVLAVPGRRIDAGAYNALAGKDGAPFMPLAMGASRVAVDQEDPFRPAMETFVHDAVQRFTGDTGGDLRSLDVRRYWLLEESGDPSVHIGARLQNGDVWLAERRAGEGRVLQLACSPGFEDSNLPTRRMFVPLMHELVNYLAGNSGPGLNLEPGQGLDVLLPYNTDRRGLTGLRGEYFSGRDFIHRVLTRTDKSIDFSWSGSPAPGVSGDHFTVRWSGALIPPTTGSYRFEIWPDDRADVWLNDKRIIRGQGDHTLTLTAGEHYPVRVELTENTGQARAELIWTGPNRVREVIPASSWSPLPAAGSEPEILTAPQVVDSDGAPREARLERLHEGYRLQVDGAARPGLYTAIPDADTRDLLKPYTGPQDHLYFGVRWAAEESRLASLNEVDRGFINARLDLLEATSADEIRLWLEGRSFGTEVWPWLAGTAVAALLLEVILARWISMRRRRAVDVQLPRMEDKLQAGHIGGGRS